MKRIRPKFLLVAISLCIAFSNLLTLTVKAKETKGRPIPGTAIFVLANDHTPVLSSKHYEVNEPYLKLEMNVPQIKGTSSAEFEKTFNKKQIAAAKKRKKEAIHLAKSYNKDFIKDQLTPIQFEYIEDFTVIPSMSPFFVIEQFNYQYSGGAHGITNLSYIVLDLNTHQQVTLKQLFKDGIDYKAVINEQVKKVIQQREKEGEIFFTGSNGFESITEEQPFFINNKGELVIVFNVYEIAPYAAGPQYITIPMQTLLPFLK